MTYGLVWVDSLSRLAGDPDPDSRPGGADCEMENYVDAADDEYWEGVLQDD